MRLSFPGAKGSYLKESTTVAFSNTLPIPSDLQSRRTLEGSSFFFKSFISPTPLESYDLVSALNVINFAFCENKATSSSSPFCKFIGFDSSGVASTLVASCDSFPVASVVDSSLLSFVVV